MLWHSPSRQWCWASSPSYQLTPSCSAVSRDSCSSVIAEWPFNIHPINVVATAQPASPSLPHHLLAAELFTTSCCCICQAATLLVLTKHLPITQIGQQQPSCWPRLLVQLLMVARETCHSLFQVGKRRPAHTYLCTLPTVLTQPACAVGVATADNNALKAAAALPAAQVTEVLKNHVVKPAIQFPTWGKVGLTPFM